jgi:hypothetical protein
MLAAHPEGERPAVFAEDALAGSPVDERLAVDEPPTWADRLIRRHLDLSPRSRGNAAQTDKKPCL